MTTMEQRRERFHELAQDETLTFPELIGTLAAEAEAEEEKNEQVAA